MSKTTYVVAVFLLLLSIAGLAALGIRSASLYDQDVLLPTYYSAECSARADNMAQLTIDKHTDTPALYHCTTSGTGKYVPLVNGVQCEYTVTQFSAVYGKICKGNVNSITDMKNASCIDAFDDRWSADNTETITVAAGDTLYLDSDRVFGDAVLKAKYPSYGLKVTQADGYKTATTTSCVASSIEDVTNSDAHTLDLKNRIEVIPDAPFNAVTRFSSARSTQLVKIASIENGNPIYISRPGFYFKVSKAEDGVQFVDTRKEINNAKIQCIPRTTGCSDDATTIPLVSQSCDQYGGAITSFAPVQGDATKLCKYSCDGGKLQLTSSCIAVQQTPCPTETPLWNTATGKCVALKEMPPQETADLFYVYLALAVVIVILVAILIKQSMPKKGGRRR